MQLVTESTGWRLKCNQIYGFVGRVAANYTHHSPSWIWHLSSKQKQGRFEPDMVLCGVEKRKLIGLITQKSPVRFRSPLLIWGCSLDGGALVLQSRGREFESRQFHVKGWSMMAMQRSPKPYDIGSNPITPVCGEPYQSLNESKLR